MIEWAKLQQIDGYIRKLDILIDKCKNEFTGNCFNYRSVSDLKTSLNNLEKFINPEYTPGKPSTQQNLINVYLGSIPHGSFILNSINDQRERIGGLYLKEYVLTLNNFAVSEAKTVIINELNLINDREIVLKSGGSELSDWSNSLRKHLNSKLEYLNLTPIVTTQQPHLKGLQTNLSTYQLNNLFELLVNGEFIPGTTEKDCFKWVFGDHKQSRPDQWKPITWEPAKQGLRELLTPILGTITNQHIRQIEQLFLKDGKPFKMSKAKKDEHSARCTDIEKILSNLNLENKPTNTDHV